MEHDGWGTPCQHKLFVRFGQHLPQMRRHNPRPFQDLGAEPCRGQCSAVGDYAGYTLVLRVSGWRECARALWSLCALPTSLYACIRPASRLKPVGLPVERAGNPCGFPDWSPKSGHLEASVIPQQPPRPHGGRMAGVEDRGLHGDPVEHGLFRCRPRPVSQRLLSVSFEGSDGQPRN